MDLEWRGESKRAAKDLFGRPLRVALAAWIVGRAGAPFYLQEAQDAMHALGEARSGVHKELRTFEAHGMLTSVPIHGRVYFTVLDGPLWTALASAATALKLVLPAPTDADA